MAPRMKIRRCLRLLFFLIGATLFVILILRSADKNHDDVCPDCDQQTERHQQRPLCRGQRHGITDGYILKHYGKIFDPKCYEHQPVITAENRKVHYLVEGVKCEGFRIIHHTDGHIVTRSIGILREGQILHEFFYKVKCGPNTTGLVNIHRRKSLVRSKQARFSPNGSKLNVIMIGFDSVSGPGAVHMLGPAWKYFEQEMHGVRMEAMNIVGDGTPQALIPLFTGQNELELPHVRRDQSDSKYLDDVYPMIQFKFEKKGYITSFFERMTNVGVFQYRLRGFRKWFTDFGSYPYYRTFEKSLPTLFCFENKLEHTYNMEIHRRIISTYPDVPKFLFAFAASSHEEPAMVRALAGDVLQYLKFLNHPDRRHNTVVILMTDHGPRYAGARATYNGRIDERNPFFAISLPENIIRSHPYAFRNLKANAQRLATMYDAHATLLDILHGIPRTARNYKPEERGISFFHEIPLNRTCDAAGVAPHWCTCLKEVQLPLTHSLALQAATLTIQTVNNLSEAHRSLCVEQELSQIAKVILMSPNDEMLTFSGSKDLHGFHYGFRANVVGNSSVQVTLSTRPNNFTFQATLAASSDGKMLAPPETQFISILSRYGNSPHCVMDKYPSLRKFCICRERKL